MLRRPCDQPLVYLNLSIVSHLIEILILLATVQSKAFNMIEARSLLVTNDISPLPPGSGLGGPPKSKIGKMGGIGKLVLLNNFNKE